MGGVGGREQDAPLSLSLPPSPQFLMICRASDHDKLLGEEARASSWLEGVPGQLQENQKGGMDFPSMLRTGAPLKTPKTRVWETPCASLPRGLCTRLIGTSFGPAELS